MGSFQNAFAPSYGQDSVLRLKGIYQDLVSLGESRLVNIERLDQELKSQIEDFRHLLDKNPKNDSSRSTLTSENTKTLKLSEDESDTEFEINNEFKEESLRVADALDLDELESARLFYQSTCDADEFDRKPLASALIMFHRQRQFTLACVYQVLSLAIEIEEELPGSTMLKEMVTLILSNKAGRLGSGSTYFRKCVDGMLQLEIWQTKISERVESVSMTDQAETPEFTEIMEFQRLSLLKQHESLALIASTLIRGGHTDPDDFVYLLSKVKPFDKYDLNLIHHLLIVGYSVIRFASSEGFCSPEDARSIHQSITSKRDNASWALQNFQACTAVLWVAEYSGRLVDQPHTFGSDADADQESKNHSRIFLDGLKEGGFHLILAVCQGLKTNDWHDPAREGFTAFLIQDASSLRLDSVTATPPFERKMMEMFQLFAESFITYMPDTLRRLKFDEDEQRRNMQSRVQLRSSEYELHFERFLIIVAYAFSGFPDAAEGFWNDPDSNLYGFLQWASQRQSTPRTAAFCEMICSLSDGSTCATQAHEFLLQDSTSTITNKLRRYSPLGWVHILREIEYYTANVREKLTTQAALNVQPASRQTADAQLEPETAMMLECYLRLISTLARNSESARSWFWTQQDPQQIPLQQHLFHLCSSAIESRLRACAFTALTSLLTNKIQAWNDSTWAMLDMWIYGGVALNPSNVKTQFALGHNQDFDVRLVFDRIATGFEEPNSFVGLLLALVVRDAESSDGLSSTDGWLPFPETLATTYRMPGIDGYVDFVLGQVFASKSRDLSDPIQLNILRWNCMQFAVNCIGTFNESLVGFAHRTAISVDSAIETTSVSAYMRLHPFGRVIEWMFNDLVIDALFTAADQDTRDIDDADPDSPLVLSVLKSIEAIGLVLRYQSTYFDLVRPEIKKNSANRRAIVANSALISFEDAILNHLYFVTNLGLYIGSGHLDLTLASIDLLHQLATSRKLAAPFATGMGKRSEKSRLVTAFERDNVCETVSHHLVRMMDLNVRELEEWQSSAGFAIKQKVLEFLTAGIDTVPGRPTIAHLLLGFSCNVTTLSIAADSSFASGDSLFHAIMELCLICPNGLDGVLISGMLQMKDQCLQLLNKLWNSPLSSTATISELRENEFFFHQATQQTLLRPDTVFDGRTIHDADFFLTESADSSVFFLRKRSSFLEYAAIELRSLKTEGISTILEAMQASLLGSTKLSNGAEVDTPTVFEYLDFLDYVVDSPTPAPESQLLSMEELQNCMCSDAASMARYNATDVSQLMMLRVNELKKQNPALWNDATREKDREQLRADMDNIQIFVQASNSQADMVDTAETTLRAWIHLVETMLDTCAFTATQSNSFCLQLLTLVAPRLERSFMQSLKSAVPLAQLCRSLMYRLSKLSGEQKGGDSIETSKETLLDLFRISLSGLQSSLYSPDLRAILYQICHTYFQSLRTVTGSSQPRRNALQSIKSRGDTIMEIVCDDAYAGEGPCRVSSLLFLNALVAASNETRAAFVIDSLNRVNFFQVLVDNIRSIPVDIQSAVEGGDLSEIVSYFDASLLLLLTLSRTRIGATHVLEAGFFQCLRDSGLFAADPDIGLELDNPEAFSKYFVLLLSCLRVINAVVLSKGAENDAVIGEARRFVLDNRPTVVSIFKRAAGIGYSPKENLATIRELVENLTLLITTCGFLDSEQENLGQGEEQFAFS